MSEQAKIAAKMAAAAKRIGYGVQKDGHNAHQKYDYTSAANVRLQCGKSMGEERIAVSSVLTVLCSEQRMSANGKPQNHVEVLATLTFIDADSGESLTAQGIGCGTSTTSGSHSPAATSEPTSASAIWSMVSSLARRDSSALSAAA